MTQRLAPGNADSVQNSAAVVQKCKDVIFIRSIFLAFSVHQRRIVAERTAEIAAECEYGAGDLARKIEQSEFL